MEIPLTITAHDLSLPESVEAIIREKASKLERFHRKLIGCHVTVTGPGAHHRNGAPYKVCIDLSVPGSELVINQKGDPDLAVAVRDAFEAAYRRLDAFESLQRESRKIA
jgi:ribosome-associated translation inhibitor RaiA